MQERSSEGGRVEKKNREKTGVPGQVERHMMG